MSRARRIKWGDLPLFASDDEIGSAMLGPVRASEFRGHAALLERQGFPKIDARWGGRYTPACKRFFDAEYGLESVKPHNPSGIERPETWAQTKRRA